LLETAQDDQKLVELTEKNKGLIYEGATIILIRKELVQFKLAIENK